MKIQVSMVCLLILAVISVNSAGTFRLEDVLRNMNNIAQSSNDEGKVVNCGMIIRWRKFNYNQFDHVFN